MSEWWTEDDDEDWAMTCARVCLKCKGDCRFCIGHGADEFHFEAAKKELGIDNVRTYKRDL